MQARMKAAFDDPQGSANFNGVAPARSHDRLFLLEVFHKTFIAVDELGVEAAAATVAVTALAAAAEPAQPIEVRVDRPFVFAIQQVRTGVCLFLGQVSDPR